MAELVDAPDSKCDVFDYFKYTFKICGHCTFALLSHICVDH